jgi:hypothetical protein
MRESSASAAAQSHAKTASAIHASPFPNRGGMTLRQPAVSGSDYDEGAMKAKANLIG